MPLQPQQAVALLDRQGRDLGRLAIDRIEGDLVFGQFTPGPEYSQVERLFSEYVASANDQLLGIVGELDAKIAALGLHLSSANGVSLPAIHDVQIGEGVVTFRTRSSTGSPGQASRDVAPMPAPIIPPDVHSA